MHKPHYDDFQTRFRKKRVRRGGRTVDAWRVAIAEKDPTTGKERHLWSAQRYTQKEALKCLDAEVQARRAARERAKRPGAQRTVRDFADEYANRPAFAEGTRMQYVTRLKAVIAKYGDMSLEEFADRDLVPMAENKPSAGVVVKYMLEDAVQRGLIARNPLRTWKPAYKLKKGYGAVKKPYIITFAELRQLVRACHEVHGAYGGEFAVFLLIAAWTCMRPGEIAALRWRDIDPIELTVDVREQVLRDGSFDVPKNGLARRITFPPAALDALDMLPGRDAGELLRSRSDELVFRSKQGKLLTSTLRGQYWRPVKEASGVPIARLYNLRHWGASKLAEAGVPPAVIALQLGHRDGGILAGKVYILTDEILAHEARLEAHKRLYLDQQRELLSELPRPSDEEEGPQALAA